MMTKAIIFGIAGCTNSGKTTISKNIVEILKKKNLKVLHICQDDFYKTKEEVKQISHENDENEWFYHYDEPDSVNLQQMLEKIEQEAEKNDFLVVEGNMICEFEQVLNLLDHILFFTMEENECRKRREQRNYDPPDKPGYFEQIVWPSYLQHYNFAQKLKANGKDVCFIHGTCPFDSNLQESIKKIEDSLKNLVRIQKDEINTTDLEKFVNLPNCGAISTFIGITRDNFHGKTVVSLDYECYEPMARKEMLNVCNETRLNFPKIERIAIFHRIGRVNIGETSVAISTSSPHREDAINGTHFAIDLLKKTVPIFKKEIYADGTNSWKENSEFQNLQQQLCCKN